MSSNYCPSCQTPATDEARFCRQCGALLVGRRATDGNLGGHTVSPLANTAPLPALPEGAASPFSVAFDNLHDTDEPATESKNGEPSAFNLAERLREGKPFLADDYGHVVTPDNDPDLEEFLAAPEAFARADDVGLSEETIVRPPAVWRPTSVGDGVAPPSSFAGPVTDEPTAPLTTTAAAGSPPSSLPSPSVNSKAVEKRAMRVWLSAAAGVFGIFVLSATLLAAWYLTRRLLRRSPPPPLQTATAPVEPGAPDSTANTLEGPQQQAWAKLNEAEQLQAAGDVEGALARLREAVLFDANNSEVRRRLARLLSEKGARPEAIIELLALTQLEPNNADGWRQLAEAQAAEGLYAEASASYRRLFALPTANTADERAHLAYADALRLSGQMAEARAAYQRLATTASAEFARLSRQRLIQLESDERAGRSKDPRPRAGDKEGATTGTSLIPTEQLVTQAPVAQPSPTAPVVERPAPRQAPSLTPDEHYQRGVNLWGGNRSASLAEFRAAAAAGHPDASYYLGLGMAEGRDPQTLQRAELVAALGYFQRARAGRFAAQARRYEDQLGKEYDKRRKSER